MVGHLGNAPSEQKHRVYNPVRLFNGLLTHLLKTLYCNFKRSQMGLERFERSLAKF